VHPPAAAGRDASELLDVDVDQVTDPVVLVADDLAQLLAGRWIEVPESVESSPHAVNGRGRECDAVQPLWVGGEPGWSVLGLPSQRLHQVGDAFGGAGGAGGGAGGVVE
jgi:hypothetical protein